VPLESWKTLAETVQSAVTSVAVLVGGVWAYFKLIKGRTFSQWRSWEEPDLDRPHPPEGV
jgi:hypothetical protein